MVVEDPPPERKSALRAAPDEVHDLADVELPPLVHVETVGPHDAEVGAERHRITGIDGRPGVAVDPRGSVGEHPDRRTTPDLVRDAVGRQRLVPQLAQFRGRRSPRDVAESGEGGLGFEIQIAAWLWFTVVFATYAEAVAEARGRAQAATLRKARSTTTAYRRTSDGSLEAVGSAELRKGDIVEVNAVRPVRLLRKQLMLDDACQLTRRRAVVRRDDSGDLERPEEEDADRWALCQRSRVPRRALNTRPLDCKDGDDSHCDRNREQDEATGGHGNAEHCE